MFLVNEKKCNSVFQIEFQMIFPALVVCASAPASQVLSIFLYLSLTPADESLAPCELRPHIICINISKRDRLNALLLSLPHPERTRVYALLVVSNLPEEAH